MANFSGTKREDFREIDGEKLKRIIQATGNRDEYAKAIGCSRNTIYNWLTEGRIPMWAVDKIRGAYGNGIQAYEKDEEPPKEEPKAPGYDTMKNAVQNGMKAAMDEFLKDHKPEIVEIIHFAMVKALAGEAGNDPVQ
jgi:hypothetical protein